MYADSAPMHSDGLPNEPKRSHMSSLHHTLAALNGVLLSQQPQVHRAYALPVYDGKDFTTPRVFRSGLTSCDAQSALQMWSTSSSSSSSFPPQHPTQLFFVDTITKASFCLAISDAKLPVSVAPCDSTNPPSQVPHQYCFAVFFFPNPPPSVLAHPAKPWPRHALYHLIRRLKQHPLYRS